MARFRAIRIKVADLTTAIPAGAGTFAGFSDLAASINGTAFIGTGVAQAGVYFSRSGIGAIPSDPLKVADLTTAIPGGAGTFAGFSTLAASINGTAFIGTGVAQAGVYLSRAGIGAIPTDPLKVADLTTAIPAGAGTFAGFSTLAASSNGIAFIGTGVAQAGVYLSAAGNGAIPSDPIRVADLTTAIPGGAGTFAGFSALAASSNGIAFIGTGIAQAGVYLIPAGNGAIPSDPLKVADLTTAIPGGAGLFTGFTAVSTSLGHTVFLGQGSNGQAGLYLASTPRKLIAVGDTLAGRMVSSLRLGRDGFDGNRVAFIAGFTDGTEGVFLTTVNPSFAVFDALVQIEKSSRAKAGQFDVDARFILGAGSNGLDLAKDSVSLQLSGGTGAFSITVPAGSFITNKSGASKFSGMIAGVTLEAIIHRSGAQAFEIALEGKGANLAGLANPLTVTLTIGDDSGRTTVRGLFD